MISPQDCVKELLVFIGENPDREGLKNTPIRVLTSWVEELFAGYRQDPELVLQTKDETCGFAEGACDEMVILKNVEFYSTCEHHMAPFFGRISVGYLPSGKVAGVSKLAKLVDVFARRLQIQERMTQQIADTLVKVLHPKGVMVVAEAQHLCMLSRGVKKQNSVMVTSAVRGVFKAEALVREEFLRLIGK